ncbi:WD repeat-containing protein 46-like isoform X1 [Oratosquilla oratoria]|uniref:WD repeat-containing protein 46-like isoform X1 n=2 Tax=Oratosquilla oratoria TaxID=337810 RepID=UPI003F776C84
MTTWCLDCILAALFFNRFACDSEMGKPSAPVKGNKPHKRGKLPSKQGGKKVPQSFTNADGVKIKEMEINNDDMKRPGGVKKKKKLFPGRKPVDPKLVEKYTKGEGVRVKKFKNPVKRYKMKRKEAMIKAGEKDTARTEILLTESSGHLEAEEGTYSSRITQQEIREAVDITTAAKSFDLTLHEFGPYKHQYTRNGRHLLIGGKKGHLAAFDWLTKNLHFEINVMESIHDICWLHTEQMIAVAQKKWTYIYDNQGIELHCLKRMDNVLKLEFLPYHFLLCSANETGFLSWLDITLGEEIIQYPTHKGRIEAMCQNPYNAVLCCGHSKGTVTMWTPNSKEPVATMLCHPHPIKAITIDPSGRYMATAGVDRMLKIWDARNLGESLSSYKIRTGASNLAFSQKKLLAVSYGSMVEVYKDITTDGALDPYMHHNGKGYISSLQFCPYEDVLGVGAYGGVSSLIIPGRIPDKVKN